MKKISIFILTIFLFILNTSCTSSVKSYDIVTTLFAQYDIAKQISKDKLSVKMIIPFGVEAHGFEPTAKDIVAIRKSKLFIFTSSSLDTWMGSLNTKKINALNLSLYSDAEYPNNQTLTQADKLHYWTDPVVFLNLINVIRDEIIKIDPENSDFYTNNAATYYEEVNAIHTAAQDFFIAQNDMTIYFAGHSAMGAFAKRYGFTIYSISENFQPDADLTPVQLTEMKRQIKESGTKYLFVEELQELRAALTLKASLIKDGINLNILELHAYHNIKKEQDEQGITYANLFAQNLNNLKTAQDS